MTQGSPFHEKVLELTFRLVIPMLERDKRRRLASVRKSLDWLFSASVARKSGIFGIARGRVASFILGFDSEQGFSARKTSGSDRRRSFQLLGGSLSLLAFSCLVVGFPCNPLQGSRFWQGILGQPKFEMARIFWASWPRGRSRPPNPRPRAWRMRLCRRQGVHSMFGRSRA